MGSRGGVSHSEAIQTRLRFPARQPCRYQPQPTGGPFTRFYAGEHTSSIDRSRREQRKAPDAQTDDSGSLRLAPEYSQRHKASSMSGPCSCSISAVLLTTWRLHWQFPHEADPRPKRQAKLKMVHQTFTRMLLCTTEWNAKVAIAPHVGSKTPENLLCTAEGKASSPAFPR